MPIISTAQIDCRVVLIIRSVFFAVLLSFLLALLPAPACAAGTPSVTAESCIVMCQDGSVLYEKNADRRRLIASTTKLMTALVCLENAALDESVTAERKTCEVEGSSMYLRAGERYTVRELLLGLLLASGNDAALTLAAHTAGSQAEFAALMNRKAQELGLENTHYVNPHGLDAEGHYSSARDLARLMLECMENPDFRELTKTRAANVKGLTLLNHNKLLTLCPGCIGGKTGYTSAAGRCLVSCCERDGLLLVCVTLSDPDDWNDHMHLYDWAYAGYRMHELGDEFSFAVPLVSGSRCEVTAVPQPGSRAVLPQDASLEISVELPRFVFAPIEAGESAGVLTLLRNGREVYACPLVYAEGAELADAY